MRGNAEKEKEENAREIERNIDILVAPSARNTPQIQKAKETIKKMQKEAST